MNQFIIKDSPGKGKGIFTEIPFEKNQVLFRYEGAQISLEDSKKLSLYEQERIIQIGPNLYLNVKDHFGVFTNHSCNPNCYIKIAVNNAFLVAARNIAAGDELFFDYSTTSTDTIDTWSMKCNCDPFNCRKIISGFNTIPEDHKKKLISLGFVPKYVVINK